MLNTDMLNKLELKVKPEAYYNVYVKNCIVQSKLKDISCVVNSVFMSCVYGEHQNNHQTLVYSAA